MVNLTGQKKLIIVYSQGFEEKNSFINSLRKNDGYWLYFGSDYLKFKEFESYFKDKLELIEISEKLDRISDLIRDDFNHYIDDVNRNNKEIFEWWFTPLSSRNIYLSDVFQNVCYLELVKDFFRENLGKNLIIVVESDSVGLLIENWAKDECVFVESISRPYRGKLYHLYQAFIEIGKSIFKTTINFTFAKLSKIIFKRNMGGYDNINYFLGDRTALIDLFVYESNFGGDGSFNDRYFPGLESYLIKNGYNVIYHPTLTETKLNKFNLYKKIRKNERFFIIKEDYLSIFDYLKSLKMAVKAVTFNENLPYFRDIDISFADSCANKWVCFDGIFKSILVYYLFLRLGDVSRGKIERIICWHENQLQDKALSLAVHKTFPNTKIVGSQVFIRYSNYLSFYPIDSEAEAYLSPDVILTSGSLGVFELGRYLSDIPIFEGAALRYSYLCDGVNHKTELKKDILVLLPYDHKDAYELLMRVGESIGDLKEFSRVIVKCHPDYNQEIFSGYFEKNRWFERFIFSDIILVELLQSVAVVISTASGSLVEAVVSGVPTILVTKNNALCLNPFNFLKCEFLFICYDLVSLRESIIKCLQFTSRERKMYAIEGEKLRNIFFTQKNEKTMEMYIS